MAKPLDLARIRRADERLAQLLAERPHLRDHAPTRQDALDVWLDTHLQEDPSMAKSTETRPRGRPKGTGKLGGREERRLTIRLSEDLYTRFAAFAEGRHFHRGGAQYSDCARDALEHYLACPHKRLTIIPTAPAMNERETTGNEPASHLSSVDNCPTENRKEPHLPSDNIRPTEKETVPSLPSDNIRLTKNKTTLAIRAEVESLEDMPLHPDVDIDQAVAEVPAQGHTPPRDSDPLERDSVEWRRWAVLGEVQRVSGPLMPAQILKELEAIADGGLALNKALIRADLEFWCKAGMVSRAASGGYVAQTAPMSKPTRPRKRQPAPSSVSASH